MPIDPIGSGGGMTPPVQKYQPVNSCLEQHDWTCLEHINPAKTGSKSFGHRIVAASDHHMLHPYP